MKKFIFSSILLLSLLNANSQQLPLSQEIAATIMNNWKDSFSLDNKPAKWTYDMGVVLQGIEGVWLATGEGRYFNYIQQQVDYFVKEDGSIKTYKSTDFNLDNINNGKLLLILYQVTQKEKYLKAAQILFQQFLLRLQKTDQHKISEFHF